MMHIKKLAAAWAFFSMVGCSDLPRHYTAPPITGTIVDASSGDPITGAIVIANWAFDPVAGTIATMFSPSRHRRITFKIQEVITDKNGKFKIPGWKNRPRPVGMEISELNDPHLVIFKPGFMPLMYLNEIPRGHPNGGRPMNGRHESVRKSFYDGRQIRLTPYTIEASTRGQQNTDTEDARRMKILASIGSFAQSIEYNIMRSPDPRNAAALQAAGIIEAEREARRIVLLSNIGGTGIYWESEALEIVEQNKRED